MRSTTSSRRALLKFGLAGSAVALTQIGTGPAGSPAEAAHRASEITPDPFSSAPDPGRYGGRLQQIAEEVRELITYRRRLYAARRKKVDEYGNECEEILSAVFHSVPLHTSPPPIFHARLFKDQLAIPEPQITLLHEAMTGYGNLTIAHAISELAKHLRLVPACAHVVDTISLFDRDNKPVPRSRVMSPRYTVDMDEPDFSMRTTANMIIDATDGIWGGWAERLHFAVALARQGCTPMVTLFEVKPIEVRIVHDAFMLEFFAWSTGAGRNYRV